MDCFANRFFLKHHETTQAFIRSLEFLAPSVHSIEALRSHSVYAAFEKRWQLPVYFQLRWKEIVSKLEDALAVTSIDPSIGKGTIDFRVLGGSADILPEDKEPFVTTQAAAVWTAISTCWSAEVYIPELSHRFWKFTLQVSLRYMSLDNCEINQCKCQLLSRYKTWLDTSIIPPFEPTPKVVAALVADRVDIRLIFVFACSLIQREE